MAFFSDIQGKFKEQYTGRYFGHIIELVGGYSRQLIYPFLPKGQKMDRGDRYELTPELSYIEDAHDANTDISRRCDLAIRIYKSDGTLKFYILVEIKAQDRSTDNQLSDYVNWCRADESVRSLVVLTVNPLESDESIIVNNNSSIARHMYVTEYVDLIAQSATDGLEYKKMVLDYFQEEGYIMNELSPTERDAFLHFMTTTFLPHKHGWGRNSDENRTGIRTSKENVKNGPIAFAKIVQNWQLISQRLSSIVSLKQAPTVRYLPEQVYKSDCKHSSSLDIEEDFFLVHRDMQDSRLFGRMWLTADGDLGEGIKLEWGQIIQIENGKGNSAAPISIFVYALIRKKGVSTSLGQYKIKLDDGMDNPIYYKIDKFLECIQKVVREAAKRGGLEIK